MVHDKCHCKQDEFLRREIKRPLKLMNSYSFMFCVTVYVHCLRTKSVIRSNRLNKDTPTLIRHQKSPRVGSWWRGHSCLTFPERVLSGEYAGMCSINLILKALGWVQSRVHMWTESFRCLPTSYPPGWQLLFHYAHVKTSKWLFLYPWLK